VCVHVLCQSICVMFTLCGFKPSVVRRGRIESLGVMCGEGNRGEESLGEPNEARREQSL